MLPPHTAGGDFSSQLARVFSDQHVLHPSAWQNSAELKAGGHFARQIFRAVNSHIDLPRRERSLNLAGEKAFPPRARIQSLRCSEITAGGTGLRFDFTV